MASTERYQGQVNDGAEANFHSLRENMGRFNLRDKTFLIPQMNRMGGRLLAATMRGFGIRARLMDTYKGLELGMKYTSGKECYPCLVTVGDVLHFLSREKERMGDAFHAEDYVYFMPESDGPCRFGMYNKYQRIVLDSFPEFRRVKIGALTAEDGYSAAGIIEKKYVGDLQKAAYLSFVVGDILDRLLWRIRPYEKEAGMADALMENSLSSMEDQFEVYGAGKHFDKILDRLEEVIEEGKEIVDPRVFPKPLVGIVGEIYLRTHNHSNQDLIRALEKYGAEVVNASVSEWMNYVSYDGLRSARIEFRLNLKALRFASLKVCLKKMVHSGGDLLYKEFRQRQVYSRVRDLLDLAEDHRIADLERILKASDLFSFDIRTETCLSIASVMKYASEGYNGVVNVYPFTCMPSTTTAAIIRPLMNRIKVPYLDTPYDSSVQPGRETSIRTFMYQAYQHFKKHGRKR